MSSAPINADPTSSKDSGLGALALIVIAVAAIVLWWMRPSGPPMDEFVGMPLPPLNATGWLNSDSPPAEASVVGKVVVIDCFASWCGPCREKMPKLVEFNKRFHDRGVVVVGLSPEAGDEVKDLKEYVKSVEGLDWPVGYGAEVPLSMLGIEGFPTMIVFDRTGHSVWGGYDMAQLEDATIAAVVGK